MDGLVNEFERQHVIIQMFIDSAETYIQLATGAIFLSATFGEKVMAKKGRLKVEPFLFSSWIALLISIGAGAIYQYAAIKFLDLKSGFAGSPGLLPSIFLHRPALLYGTMIVTFYLGAILFTISAIRRLREK